MIGTPEEGHMIQDTHKVERFLGGKGAHRGLPGETSTPLLLSREMDQAGWREWMPAIDNPARAAQYPPPKDTRNYER